MRLIRPLAIVSATVVVASVISAPAIAVAKESAPEQRITLEPAAVKSGDRSGAAATPAVQKLSPAKADYPPLSQATLIPDLSKVAACKSDTDRTWMALLGPSDVKVGGWAQCTSGVWSFRAQTGSGHIGGMTLAANAFSGSISIAKNGSTSGTILVSLPWGKSVLPGGKATGRMSLKAAGSELAGTIHVQDSSSHSSVTMDGKVADTGNFNLAAQGKVDFAGTRIPVSGTYRSGSNAVRARGAKPTWLLTGSGGTVKFDGASISQPSLRLSSDYSDIRGDGHIRLQQYGLQAAVALSIPADNRWQVTFSGSDSVILHDARLTGLTLVASRTSGSISASNGRTTWDVRLPMKLVDDELALTGTATMVSPGGIRLAPSAGVGDMFHDDNPLVFDKGVSSVLLKGRTAQGNMGVQTEGEYFVDMPEGWTSSTVLELTPVFKGSKPAVLKRTMQHNMTEGASKLTLKGDMPAADEFSLDASGYLVIGKTKIPVDGSYIGPGPSDTGSDGKMTITARTDDAPGGYADLGNGAKAIDTKFVWSTEDQSTSGLAARAATLPPVTYTATSSNSTKSSGTVTLTVADVQTSGGDDSITFTGTWSYSNSKYTVSVKGTGSAYWEPYKGFDIPIASISGTITADDSKAVTSWNMQVSPAVTWNVGDGMTLTTALGMSSTCPSDKIKTSCPKTQPPDTFWTWGSSSIMNVPVMAGVTIPTVTATGAFLSDASWVRWDGFVNGGKAVTIDGPANSSVSMANAQVTMFSGATRDDTVVPPDLEMPDLSGLSRAKLNIQACGTFKIVIFSINTGNSQGCVALTPAGKVLGQSKTGGSTPSGDDTGGQVTPTNASEGGLTLNDSKPTQINGYGYSDIDPQSTPTKQPTSVKLYNQVLKLLPKQDSFTAKVNVPGSLMSSFGTGISADTQLVATGWFKPQTEELYVDLDIPVNLKASGAKVDDINLSLERVQKQKDGPYSYTLVLDATGEVAVDSHHYPFDADITLKTGTTDEAAVSLSVMGESSSQTVGNFDDTSLLTEGDFEPPNGTLLDGSFDSGQPASDFKDGGFEGGTPTHNLVTNSSFEDSTSWNLLPDDVATMDGNVSGSTLVNGNFDDTDLLINGDIEGVDGMTGTGNGETLPPAWWPWPTGSSTVIPIVSNTGPSGDGAQAMAITNSGTSATYYTGAYQYVWVSVDAVPVTYRLTGYAMPGNSAGTTLYPSIDGPDYVAGSPDASSQVKLTPGQWTPFSLDMTAKTDGAGWGIGVYLQAPPGGGQVIVDDLTFGPVSGTLSSSSVPGVARPSIIETFDTPDNVTYNKSSGVSLGSNNGNGYLQTNGCNNWWSFKNDSIGYVDGDFDFSTTISFPGNTREIANVGFYMDDTGGLAVQGYAFRIQTPSSNDGGFYQLTGSKYSSNGSYMKPIGANGKYMPDVQYGHTYRLKLLSTLGHVTADVRDVTDPNNEYDVFTQTVDLSNARRTGVFGQYQDGACSTAGQHWDDITVNSSTGQGRIFRVAYDSANAHSAPGYARLAGTSSSWGYQQETDASPKVNDIYTYSAWVRSAGSGNMSGNLVLATLGGTSPKNYKQAFTVGSTWTQVKVTALLPADADSIRVGISDMSSSGAVLIDDATFQKIGWDLYVDDQAKMPVLDVVPDPVGTSNVLYVAPMGGGNIAPESWLNTLFKTTEYHLTASVRAANPGTKVTGSLSLWDGDGKRYFQDFTATDDTWQVLLPIAVSSAGGTGRVTIEGVSGPLLVDDVTLTATETTSDQGSTSLGRLSPPTGWNGSPVLVNSAEMAHTKQSYLRISSNSSTNTDVAASPVPGQTMAAAVWVRAASVDTPMTTTLTSYDAAGNKLDTASTKLTATDDTYHQMIVTLPITQAGAARVNLSLQNSATSSWVAIDDVVVGLAGETLIDPWVGSGSVGLVAVDDSALAHSGSSVMRVTSKASSAALSMAAHAKPTSTMRAFSAWMKTADGTKTQVNIGLSKSGSTSGGTPYSIDGTWRLLTVNLPVTSGADDTFTSTISFSGAATVLIDDVSTRDVSPFTPINNSTTTAVVVSDATSSASSTSTSGSSVAANAQPGSGAGDTAPATEVTMVSAPSAPPNANASQTGPTEITVTWGTAQGNGYNIQYYRATDSTGKYVCQTANQAVLDCVFDNLPLGTYTFSVQAYNAVGWGSTSNKTSPVTLSAVLPAVPNGAATAPNALMVTANGAGGVQAPTTLSSGTIVGGSTYTVRAQVSAASGTSVSGTIGLNFGSQAGTPINPQLEEGDSAAFTVSDSWTKVTATFVAPGTGTYTSFTPTFNLSGSGTLFIDSVTVSPVTIVQDQPWTPYWYTGKTSQVAWGVYDDPTNAHDGSLGVLKMTSSDPKEAGVYKTFNVSTQKGDVYNASAWVRSATDDTALLRMDFQGLGGTTEGSSQVVTLTQDWQLITLRMPTTSNHTSMKVALVSQTSGVQIFADDVSVLKNVWTVDDASSKTNLVNNPSFESGTSGWSNPAGATMVQSDVTSFDGAFSGELVRAEGSTGDDFVEYDLPNMTANTTYTVSAYVWIPGGAQASDVYGGRDLLWFVDYGGTSNNITMTMPDFTRTMEWQRITTTLKASSTPNMNIRFYVPTDGGWYVDGIVVEQGSTPSGYFAGTVPGSTLSVLGDAVTAYEGSGYARLSTVNNAGVTMSTPAAGTQTGTQYLTAWIRSATDDTAAGTLSLSSGCSASTPFTAVKDWQKISVNCTMPSAGGKLNMNVKLSTPGGAIDVDSVQLTDTDGTKCSSGTGVYGVDCPLAHPESGNHYLWDDAFGIPGMHLWAFTIQIEVIDGEPGLGVQATVYQDPTALPVLYGTEWLKSDVVLNIDEVQPCFAFDFGNGDGQSGISIGKGAIKADEFTIAFAPRGCAVGKYKVPMGASVLFDAAVGDGTVHFDLSLTKNAEGQPTFKGDASVTQLNLGGIQYHDMEMSVFMSPTDDSVTYVADMTLPMGEFNGSYNMYGITSGKTTTAHVDGNVDLKNWGWTSNSGKGLKVNNFDFDFSMDVGTDNCGTLQADADGNANADFAMATKIDFDGSIKVVCGVLSVLDIVFDYTHGGLTEDFYLKYDSASLTLAGGVEYDFERKVSWKALSHRYHRTSRIAVYMNFLMDVTAPQSSQATLGAKIQVADGDGSAQCTITGQPSDSCNIDVRVNSKFIGWVHFSESW